MERKKYGWTMWISPIVGLLMALWLYVFVSGCSFLGIVLGGVTIVSVAFRLVDLWQMRQVVWAKRARWALRILVLLLLIASLITLVPILRGPGGVSNEADYLIVLGAGVRGTEPSEILQDRIDHAFVYLVEHPDAICIATGGKGSDENISEAQCIYDHLTVMGIAGERIWLEDQATSTIENFRYSIALIRENTGAEPGVVTVLSNEFHLYRASVMAQDCGLTADFVAAPTSSVWIRINYTLREIFALWKYLTIGG